MRFLQFLFGKAPDMATPAIDPGKRAPRGWPVLPKWQPQDADPQPGQLPPTASTPPPAGIPPTDIIQLGDLHVAIEYEDASGNETTRNITMQEIGRGPNAPVLKAICHTRHAVRHFRTDRIVNVITSDGEVLPVARFFRDVAGIDLRSLAPGAQEESLKTARALRDFLRPALSILVVAAKTDDQFHSAELAAIMAYVETEASFLREYDKFTQPVGADEIAALEPLIRTMRPQASSVRACLNNVLSQRPERFDRFRAALLQVVRADGVVSLPEAEFLEELDRLRVEAEVQAIAEWDAFGLAPNDELRGTVNRKRLFNADRE